MAGTYCDDLFKETYHERTIGILKGAMGKFVFNTPDILKLELSAQVILSFLLEHFVRAALYSDYSDAAHGYVPSKADKNTLRSSPIITNRITKRQRLGTKRLTCICVC